MNENQLDLRTHYRRQWNTSSQRACIIHDKTAYGQGVAEEFQKAFKASGGTVLSFDGISVADKDFNALLTRLQPLNAQLIYFGVGEQR